MKYFRDGGTEGPYALETYGYDAATGNLTSKAGVGIGYNTQAAGCPHGALSKEHAATSAGTNSYCYDPNGNMARRTIAGVNYSMTYNAENRLTGMTDTGVNASFVYDGDGARVQGVVGGATVAYVGAHYEWSSAGNTRYYYAGALRVAMRRASYAVDNGVFYLFGDHLGSTSVIANSSGGQHSEQMYKPWGEKRYPTGASALLTTYRFTGQRQESGLGPSGGEGLYYYGARWFDPYLGRFVQADTIVPGMSSQYWDRYAYVENNPLKYIDPSGHTVDCPLWDTSCRNTPTNDQAAARYGIKFKGGWDNYHKWAAIRAAYAVGAKFGAQLKKPSSIAFQTIYSTGSRQLVFLWGNTHESFYGIPGGDACDISSGGCTVTYKDQGWYVCIIDKICQYGWRYVWRYREGEEQCCP